MDCGELGLGDLAGEGRSRRLDEPRTRSCAGRSSLLKVITRAVVPLPTRELLRCLYYCASSPRRLLHTLGVRGALRLLSLPVWHELLRLVSRGTAGRRYQLTARDAAVALTCRVGTSDLDVFRQIFVEREYAFLSDLQAPRWMIDCGANVGFATAWFLSRYPTIRVLAVEPDPGNVAALRHNLLPFGSRAVIEESAVWSRKTGLTLVRGKFGDGREWATQVRESDPDETVHDLIATDIPTLIDDLQARYIDVLKVDIEGAERELFAAGQPEWLSAVQNLVIEIHGETLEELVTSAIPSGDFVRSRSGELTCFRRVYGRVSDLTSVISSE
jgi:FkbM family methyltransferase